jgi:tRNA-dihydrouridine synthase B
VIQINKLHIDGNLVLAPMSGFTDSPFRRIARKYGAALVFSELISSEGIVRNSKKTMDLLRFTDDERPIGIQIFGSNPAVMGEAAKRISELRPDIIDINFGCCAPKVCRGGSGAALLREPELLGAIARSVVKGGEVSVSAKIRTGWDANSLNYMTIVRILEDSGISFISVHGRTRAQRYSDKANWDVIKEINEKSNIPVIGNGDIMSHREAEEKQSYSGCRAVMIGRGAIGNPWIFSGSEPGFGERIDQIKYHLNLMIEFYGDRGIILMRKHLTKYIHGIKDASKTRMKLVQSKNIDEIHLILNSMLSG